MNIKDEKPTSKSGKYKFNDHFVKKVEKLAKVYDKELKRLRSVEKEIGNISHGVCNTAYRFRYITPSDISNYVANLDKSLSMGLIKPSVGDCNMFAVASAKRIMEEHNCAPFGANTSGGNTRCVSAKASTLKDLEMIVGTEVFRSDVYSKYELHQRLKTIRDQTKTLDEMHFTATIRNLIDKLPTIIEKHSETACANCDIKCNEILGAYVCQFIAFALKLNVMTIGQMLHYSVPKAHFNAVEDKEHEVTDSTIQEAYNEYDVTDDVENVIQTDLSKEDGKRPIFFVFSEGICPVISDAIRKATDSKFSHMGIAFEPDCRKIYTYTARGTGHENYVSGETGFGFTIDSMNDLRRQNINVSVMAGFIGADTYEKIMDEIQDFTSHKTKFDVGLFVKFLTKNSKPGKNKYAQVCSTFCDYVLDSAGVKLSDEPVASPGGIKYRLSNNEETLNNVFEVFYGNSNEYDEETAKAAIEKFAAKEGSRPFDEMYTECFHCTKPNSEIRSKIPFGINFRDIVLMDNHAHYKNTKCALDYIVNNPRSPFNYLITKFVEPEAQGMSAGEITSLMRMMFGDKLNDEEVYNDPYYRTDVQFPSDPNWLDKIAYGNIYYDLNYRTDNPGNQHTDPITAKFDILYKMFAACPHETDSVKLANSIIRIKTLMEAIIDQRKISSDWQMPRELSTEMLALLGEIFTRVLMKLYHLNTIVIDASDDMEDTMIPGFIYEFATDDFDEDDNGFIMESYIMEADEKTADSANTNVSVKMGEVKEATVKNADASKYTGIAKAMHELKMGTSKLWQWLQDTLAAYFTNWEKAQKQIIEYIENTGKKDYEQAVQGLNNGTFKITISDYTPFDVNVDSFNSLDPTGIVKQALDDKEHTYGPETEEAKKFESSMYPDMTGKDGKKLRDELMSHVTNTNSSTDKDAAEKGTVENRSAIIRNYVLFGQKDTPASIESYDLTAEELTRIRTQLLNTKDGIAKTFNSLIEKYKVAGKELNDAIDQMIKETAERTQQQSAEAIKNASSGEERDKLAKENMKEDEQKAYTRMRNIATIIRRVETVLMQASIDALIGCPSSKADGKESAEVYKNSFWGKSYRIYAMVMAEFKARDKNAGKSNNTATDTNAQPAT